MKKLAIISTFILGLAATSCDSYLDINESPNSPKESDLNASILFPAAEMNLASSYGDYLRITGGSYAQYYCQSFGTSNYVDYSQFQQSATRSSSTYTQLNARALKNFQLVREIAAKKENWGDYLAATVLRAFTYQALVDCYGEVPYTEALDASNPTPHYDDGKTVYTGILSELDEALSLAKASDPVCTNLLFPGQNADPWIKFANALKLKIYSRMGGSDAQIGAILEQGNLPTSDIAFSDGWTSEAGHISPFYAEEFATNWGSTQVNVVANIAIIGSMQVKDDEGAVVFEDPRLPKFFEKNGSGKYTGGISGTNFSTSSSYKSSYWCRPVASYDMPVYLLTLAEQVFFAAEYYARQGNAQQAEAYYFLANTYAMQTAGFGSNAAVQASKFVNQWPYDQSNYKKSIGIAKWIALAGVNPFEGYCELRRLKYPAFGTVKGSDMYNETDDSSYKPDLYKAGTLYTPIKVFGPVGDNQLLQRWPYAESSSARNSNTPAFPGYTTPIFWAQ